jgi:mannose-1-phosphate guanylyltransferase/phosphomannomutase
MDNLRGKVSLKAVVLAGGFGTRLRPLTYSRPKPMLPIGPKPVLQYVIESLADSGFNEIIITTNYLQEQIEDYFGDGSEFGVRLRYPKEETPLGTAGSVKNAARYLNETFALIQGDNITDIDMAQQLKYHKKKNALATLSVMKVNEPWKYGVVILDKQNKITGFQEKPPPEQCRSNLINTGLYVLEPDVLKLIPTGKPFDFAKDVFPIVLEQGKGLYGYLAKGFWTDIGSVEGFLEASRWLLNKVAPHISPTADVNRARIRGSVWIGDGTILETGVKIQGPVYIEGSCTIQKGVSMNPGTMLKRKVIVGDDSTINGAVVFDSTEIHSKVVLNQCILDEKCEIGSNSEIDASAIIGAGCKIGESVLIGRGVKLEPGFTVQQGKTIRI